MRHVDWQTKNLEERKILDDMERQYGYKVAKEMDQSMVDARIKNRQALLSNKAKLVKKILKSLLELVQGIIFICVILGFIFVRKIKIDDQKFYYIKNFGISNNNLVVCDIDGTKFTGYIVASKGDEVYVDEIGFIVNNGAYSEFGYGYKGVKEIRKSILKSNPTIQLIDIERGFRFRIPENYLLIIGEEYKLDSTELGLIEKDSVKGKVAYAK